MHRHNILTNSLNRILNNCKKLSIKKTPITPNSSNNTSKESNSHNNKPKNIENKTKN